MKHARRLSFSFIIAGGIAMADATPAAAQGVGCPAGCRTPNVVTGFDPVAVKLDHTLFVNKGLQGVGRIPASFVPGGLPATQETYGSVSGLWVEDWMKTSTGYSGTFLTLPDRGYNSPDAGVFSNYASRVYSIPFTFSPYTGTVPAENQIVANLGAITPTYFTYSDGTLTTRTTGLDPAANTTTLFGQTVPFVPSVNKLTVDAEALVIKADGSGYIGDEYGPNIYYFNASKEIIGAVTLPEAVRPHRPPGTLNFDSTVPPDNGRRNNQGMEGVSLSPDGKTLYALLQSATVQDSTDNQQTRLNTRLLVFDVGGPDSSGVPVHTLTGEYVLQLPVFRRNGNGGAPDRTAAQSEITALDGGKLLVLSRDGNGLGSNNASPVMFKSVLLVDVNTPGATNLAGNAAVNAEGGRVSPGGVLDPTITPLSWVEALNMLNSDQLARFMINLQTTDVNSHSMSEKWEGMALLPALDPDHPNDYFLFIANDNDFLTEAGFMINAQNELFEYNAKTQNGFPDARWAENDTVFLAYRVSIVPEPHTLLLLVVGTGGVAWAARRRRPVAAC